MILYFAIPTQEKMTFYEGNPVQKNSEFKALFGHLIFKMQQSGLMDRAVLILVGYFININFST